MTRIYQFFSHSWRRVVAVLLPLGLMALVFVVSSIPADLEAPQASSFGWVPPALQNLLHIPLYGLLAVLWFRALVALNVPGRWPFILALFFSFTYGLLDEWHQSFVPGRFASLTDVSLNLLGVVLGLCFCQMLLRRGEDREPRRDEETRRKAEIATDRGG